MKYEWPFDILESLKRDESGENYVVSIEKMSDLLHDAKELGITLQKLRNLKETEST